jgi:hypothetical protein
MEAPKYRLLGQGWQLPARQVSCAALCWAIAVQGKGTGERVGHAPVHGAGHAADLWSGVKDASANLSVRWNGGHTALRGAHTGCQVASVRVVAQPLPPWASAKGRVGVRRNAECDKFHGTRASSVPAQHCWFVV